MLPMAGCAGSGTSSTNNTSSNTASNTQNTSNSTGTSTNGNAGQSSTGTSTGSQSNNQSNTPSTSQPNSGSSSVTSLEGSYKVLSGTFGQAAPGVAIVFQNGHVNLYSPSDTYAFSNNELTVTGLLGGSITFKVSLDGKNIVLTNGDTKLTLQKQGQ